jgi:hypothetical protein
MLVQWAEDDFLASDRSGAAARASDLKTGV